MTTFLLITCLEDSTLLSFEVESYSLIINNIYYDSVIKKTFLLEKVLDSTLYVESDIFKLMKRDYRTLKLKSVPTDNIDNNFQKFAYYLNSKRISSREKIPIFDTNQNNSMYRALSHLTYIIKDKPSWTNFRIK